MKKEYLNTEDIKMDLIDTKNLYIKFDKISNRYFSLDETGNFITDEGKETFEEAEKLLNDYVIYLNGDMK